MLSGTTLKYQRTQSPILPYLLKQTLAKQKLFSRTDSQLYVNRYQKYKGHVVTSLSVGYKEAHEISSLPGMAIQSPLFRRLRQEDWELRAS